MKMEAAVQIKVEVQGLKEIQAGLKDFSERRLKAVVATALTRTAKATSERWQRVVSAATDRPTPRTQNAVAFTGARADSLHATVFLKDRMQGTAPSAYLGPQVFGGGRLLKKFEQALVSSGVMPQGYLTVPGEHATRDGYGNVSRGQLVAVIRALGEQYSPGYQRVISASVAKKLARQAKHGRQYIAVSGNDARRARVSQGIYERMADGSRKAIFLFKRAVHYKRQMSLMDRASVAEVQATAQREIDRALHESLARLAGRGGIR